MTNNNLTVEYKLISAIEPYAKNSRTHSEKQTAQIAASIKEFGFTNPVLVDGKKATQACGTVEVYIPEPELIETAG